ncbi:hypothetical protein [Burkholderia gladioli]|uniref:hypothetical protein n=1 Tax=Burkholderia gladioli TaxID=28095 RepID=UPI0016402E93|nr:hypothetical protein [Burkholderia gladioli]
MTTSRDEKQLDLNAAIEPSDDGAKLVSADELTPTFLDDEGPFDVPLFITPTNARELWPKSGRDGSQAMAHKDSEG